MKVVAETATEIKLSNWKKQRQTYLYTHFRDCILLGFRDYLNAALFSTVSNHLYIISKHVRINIVCTRLAALRLVINRPAVSHL